MASDRNLEIAKAFLSKLEEGVDPRSAADQLAGGPDATTVAKLQELQDARDRLGSGAIAPGHEPEADPLDAAMGAYHYERRAGGGREAAQAAYFDKLFTAAVNGDERVTQRPGEHEVDASKRFVEQARQRNARDAQRRSFVGGA